MSIGWKFYLVFIIVGTFFTVTFLLLARETKGKPLEEIAALFGDPVAAQTMDELMTARDHDEVDVTPPKSEIP